MNKREAHYYLEELQRMMTQHRDIFTNEFVCANGMAIQALEKPDLTLESAIDYMKYVFPDYKIIACMPLPEPYKEEKKEEKRKKMSRYGDSDYDDMFYELDEFLKSHKPSELLKLVQEAVEYWEEKDDE